jgi:hypothetical protein
MQAGKTTENRNELQPKRRYRCARPRPRPATPKKTIDSHDVI